MPIWQIGTYAGGNPSNWCHFTPVPSKDNILHDSEPTCSGRLCHFSASQLEWSFLLGCVYAEATSVATRRPKPPGWMTWTQAAEPSLDGDITSCLCAEVSHLWGASATVVSPGTTARGGWTSGSTWCHGTKADEVLSFYRFEIPLLFFNTVCYQSTRKQTHHPGLLLDQSQMPLHER